MAGGKAKVVADATLALDTGVTRWLALVTTLPTHNDGTALVEVTGVAYARVVINAADWGAVSTAADNLTEQVSIAVEKDFAQTGAGGWGTVVGWALYDALTAGALRRWGPLVDGSGNPTSQAISSGTTFGFKANTVTLKEA